MSSGSYFYLDQGLQSCSVHLQNTDFDHLYSLLHLAR